MEQQTPQTQQPTPQTQRAPGKLGLIEKIALGVGSAALTTAAASLPLFIGSPFDDIPYYALAAPVVVTAIDQFVQEKRGNDTPLLSKRYAKALGVSAIGTAVATAGITAAAWYYMTYCFTLNVGF